jgi:hypothetical protein
MCCRLIEIKMRVSTATAAALLVLAACTQLTTASHFRGATGSYKIDPATCFTSSVHSCKVDFVYTSAWRDLLRDNIQFGDGSRAGIFGSQKTVIGSGADKYEVYVLKVSHTYKSKGVYLAGLRSGNRVHNLQNSPNSRFNVLLSVDLTTSPTPLQSPVISSAILLPAAIGAKFVTVLPVAAPGSFSFSCRYGPPTC